MKLIIDIPEARYKDIQRIAEVQIERNHFKTAEQIIAKGMPIEQEPKTGHWIWCVGSHKCSNCEEYTCFSHKELLRYCPNCGADMRGEE